MKKILTLLLSSYAGITFAQDESLFQINYAQPYGDHSNSCNSYLATPHKLHATITDNDTDLLHKYNKLVFFIENLVDSEATKSNVIQGSMIYDQLQKLYTIANSKQRPIILKLINNQSFDVSELSILADQPSEKFNQILNEPIKSTRFKQPMETGETQDYIYFMLRNTPSHFNKPIANINLTIDNQTSTRQASAYPVKSGMYTNISISDNFIIENKDTIITCYLQQSGANKSSLSCNCSDNIK